MLGCKIQYLVWQCGRGHWITMASSYIPQWKYFFPIKTSPCLYPDDTNKRTHHVKSVCSQQSWTWGQSTSTYNPHIYKQWFPGQCLSSWMNVIHTMIYYELLYWSGCVDFIGMWPRGRSWCYAAEEWLQASRTLSLRMKPQAIRGHV